MLELGGGRGGEACGGGSCDRSPSLPLNVGESYRPAGISGSGLSLADSALLVLLRLGVLVELALWRKRWDHDEGIERAHRK